MPVIPEISERPFLHRAEQFLVAHRAGDSPRNLRGHHFSRAVQASDAVEKDLPIFPQKITEHSIAARLGIQSLESSLPSLGTIYVPAVAGLLPPGSPRKIDAAVMPHGSKLDGCASRSGGKCRQHSNW